MATPYDVFPVTWDGRPPAMPMGDYDVWKLFRPTLQRLWTTVAYDVELRDGAWPIVDADPSMQAMWMRNTARRVDAVAWLNNIATIIEVRHAAAWQSFGQLMGYADLWAKTYPALPVNALWLVTDQIPDDIRSVANASGLHVWTPETYTAPAVPRVLLPPGTRIESAPYRV